MIVNSSNLRTLGIGFSAAFRGALAKAPQLYKRVATVVPSTTAANEYGWLGDLPGMREWIGDRVIQNLVTHDYTIRNRDFELTVGVKRKHIEDDNLGIYAPMFETLGDNAGAHPDKLVFDTLKAGTTTKCYDGQYFFDTDHPVVLPDGSTASVSNYGGGSGPTWYLLDVTRPLKPLIYQDRKAPQFVAKDAPTDDNVFSKGEFIYGVDSRGAAGYGLWQLAYASRQPLTAENYEAARVAMGSLLNSRSGDPLEIKPNLLVVPPALEGAAKRLLKNELGANGGTNEWFNTAEPLTVPRLAA
ncbi:Mu-like prophage major head subunit gpT family protein [Pseudoroseomonas cervicalis]|uniref:Bacteriophage Mu GpT domain-containing protein n=1 Tax=Pseudoroseomonas cervicalis ATCC 49957 TaxID=525371 RepID=D5RM76_9PROT|nr:Mu-like prophage major head subunit gpT family protein [Pseudoroseomonas cervicalis]EFH11592.1 hypothetical protein HMPREF0731_2187 [Pseudoroseomonas cervicalis ATCC 49957]